MGMYFYNDDSVFHCETPNEIKDKINGFVIIPIRYETDGWGNIHLETMSMKDEFERTVSGIESVIDDVYTKHYDMLHSEDTDD